MTVTIIAAVGASAQAPDLEKMDVVMRSLPDGPVAKVQGKNIEKNEFVRLYRAELDLIERSRRTDDLPDASRAELAMMVLRTLVNQSLLHNEALERELEVSEERVEKAWKARFAEFQQELYRMEGTEFSEDEVLSKLGYSKREQVLANLERALLTEKMRTIIIRESDISISDEEVQEAFDAQSEKLSRPALLHLNQLFFDPKNDSPEKGTARKRAEDALSRLFAGQSFEAVARSFSEAPDRERGGDMGVVPVNQLPPFMVEAAMDMAPDDISGVIESEFGFHIIMLVLREDASKITLAEVAPAIRRDLQKKEGDRTVREHCRALMDDGAEVRIFLELQKNLALLNGDLRKERE